jgi:hypothetical protein
MRAPMKAIFFKALLFNPLFYAIGHMEVKRYNRAIAIKSMNDLGA